MRRILATTVLTAIMVFAAGCGDSKSGATPAASAPSATSAATASVDPNARAICDDLSKNILDADVRAFGAELGKIVTVRELGDKATAADKAALSKARQAAIAKLAEIAGKLRRHEATATDPALKGALTGSASSLDQLAADPAAFDGLTSLAAASQTTKRFTEAFDELNRYCARPALG